MKPMMTARRTRASEPNTIAGTEDISILTLSEVCSRLERNERVLNTALFSSSPTSPAAFPAPALAPSPGASATPGQAPISNTTASASSTFGTSPTSPFLRSTMSRSNGQTSPSPAQPSGDPLRDRLLAARQALLAREQELLLEESMDGMEVSEEVGLGSPSAHAESSHAARRRSSGMSGLGLRDGNGQPRSGKQRAMEAIQAGEIVGGQTSTGRMLPIAQTLAFAEREFDSAAAQRMAGMSIQPDPASNRTPTKRKAKPRAPGQFDPTDEIARAQANARMAAFMSYKGGRRAGGASNGGASGARGGEDDDDDDDDDGFFDDDWDGAEGEYDGDEDRFALGPQGREPYRLEPGTAEEVDEMGEDDEGWKEGNDEYLDRVR